MKICCIFNIAPLYRQAIFRLMDRDPALEFDFLAGEESTGGIALMDLSALAGFRGYLRNVYRKGGKLVWQKGAFRKAFARRYDAYLLTGNPGIRSNWLVALWARLRGRKVYLWTHGLSGSEKGMELRKYMLWFRMADHLLLYGERARDLLLAEGYPADRMTVIYNSLDYDRQAAIRGRIADRGFIRNYFGNDEPLLVFVGRLTAGKKLDMLLEAMEPLTCNLVLVGDGPARGELEKQVRKKGLEDRVWFYGETYDEEIIAALLYHSHACVSPGNVGLTAIHALSFGTPVITHDNPKHQNPEYEAVESGTTGSLFRENDPESLREAIRHWTSLSLQEREKRRESCYRIVDLKYNPHRQMEILRKAFLPGSGQNPI